MKRTTVAMLRSVALAAVTSSLWVHASASGGPSCERFALGSLSPGMSYDLVRRTMGGDGIPSVTRTTDSRETSAADYPGPSADVYVEYDSRIDRRKTARAVLVRTSMLLRPTIAEALVDRFGMPDAGIAEILDGLTEGVAVWVDESCGLVLTAYHPRESWWKGEGRTTLQLETLDLARRGDSPASSSLTAILQRKHGSPAAPSMPANFLAFSAIPSPGTASLANSFQANDPPDVMIAAMNDEPEQAPAMAKDKPAARIGYVPPVYPRTARWLKMSGHVTLAIAVNDDGTVTKTPRVVAETPTGQGFAEAAIEAVRTWRFSPAIKKGSPVRSTLTIDVDYEPQKN